MSPEQREMGVGGFTTIELMVAIVLGLAVVALAVTAVSRGLNGQRVAAEQHKSQLAAAEALERLGSDLRTAVAPDRLITSELESDAAAAALTAPKGTREALKQALQHPDPATRDRYRDIKLATPTTLVFRSNIHSRNGEAAEFAGSECVRWQRSGGFMVRTVWLASSACPGVESQAIDQRRMFRVHNQLGGAAFHYTLQVKTGGANDADCSSRSFNSVGSGSSHKDAFGYYDIDRITSVGVNFVSSGASGESDGEADSFTLRGRQTADYLYAIGCGY